MRKRPTPVHPYVRIRDDGTVIVFSSQIEMGQGIHTGLATIVAEELDADFASIRVVNAANGRRGDRDVYGNPELGGLFQITGASNSTKGFWGSYRLVAAKARARLVAAAADRWRVEPDEIEVDAGVLRHPSGQTATFASWRHTPRRCRCPTEWNQSRSRTTSSSDTKGVSASMRPTRSSAQRRTRSTSHFPAC